MNMQKKLILPITLGLLINYASAADSSGTWAYLKDQPVLYQAVWIAEWVRSPLFKTFLDLVKDNRVRSVRAFINRLGIDVNGSWICQETPFAESPLILAVQHGRIEIARALLEAGANVLYQDNLGHNALDYAHDVSMKALLEEYIPQAAQVTHA